MQGLKPQQGMVLILALLILLSLTILGVSAVSSSLGQSKMAVSMQRSGQAFDAARHFPCRAVFFIFLR